jgi:dihydrolipoamide dehydrogenase
MQRFDVAVLGGGPAGYKAAAYLGNHGKNVVLVERSSAKLGGTCLCEGCIPVKSLSETAHIAELAGHSAAFGVGLSAPVIDLSAARSHYLLQASQLRRGIEQLLKQSRVTLLEGFAAFRDANIMEVTTAAGHELIEAARFLIATGSRAKSINAFPITGKRVFSSSHVLELSEIPKSLLIIGGGAIGCEFASIYRSLGSEIVLAEALPGLLGKEDAETARTLAREFRKRGIDVLCGARVESLEESESTVHARIVTDEGETVEREFEYSLVAVGREPALDGLGLEKAGVATEGGFIRVDSALRTSVPSIYAAGDVIRTPMLAHTAYYEGKLAAKSILGLNVSLEPYPPVPRIVFSEPQVGAVGITEEEVKEMGLDAVVKKQFFKANGRAVVMGADAGFVKLIADKNSGVILGGSVIGVQATELVHEIALAVSGRMTESVVASTIFGHPTLSEAICDAAEMIHG